MFVTSTPPWDDSHSQSASAGGGGVTFKRDVLLLLLLLEGYVAVWCGGEKCKCGRGGEVTGTIDTWVDTDVNSKADDELWD